MADQFKQWAELISETNWKKGRIIASWIQAEPNRTYEDFARAVGGVTGLHAERLGAVWERFGKLRSQKNYNKLLWQHFYSALEWDDAKHWLREANVLGWTPTKMRQERFAQDG